MGSHGGGFAVSRFLVFHEAVGPSGSSRRMTRRRPVRATARAPLKKRQQVWPLYRMGKGAASGTAEGRGTSGLV
jgi:hypothetical protein